MYSNNQATFFSIIPQLSSTPFLQREPYASPTRFPNQVAINVIKAPISTAHRVVDFTVVVQASLAPAVVVAWVMFNCVVVATSRLTD